MKQDRELPVDATEQQREDYARRNGQWIDRVFAGTCAELQLAESDALKAPIVAVAEARERVARRSRSQ